MSINIQVLWDNLENHSKEELLDIYCNIADNIWDRRIGSKPKDFDLLPDYPKRFKRRSKSEILKPYVTKIESMTTLKERKKYIMVSVQKSMTSDQFEEWWESLNHSTC